MKKTITYEDLTKGITFLDGKDGIVAKVEPIVIPSDPKEYAEAFAECLSMMDASIERIKALPSITTLGSNKPN